MLTLTWTGNSPSNDLNRTDSCDVLTNVNGLEVVSIFPQSDPWLLAIVVDAGGLKSRVSTSAKVIGDSLAPLLFSSYGQGVHPNLFREI